VSEQPQPLRYSSGARWESIVGYSRAVRTGDIIEVSGTVSVGEDGLPFGIGDPGAQATRILSIIRTAVEALGGHLEDVVRTRIYVTVITQWEAVGRAHGAVFADIRPATSMVEVARLIGPEFLVEIEATAHIREAR
jgi:enamine deaminase RidA (YjgF/YER057c/UK114 family)